MSFNLIRQPNPVPRGLVGKILGGSTRACFLPPSRRVVRIFSEKLSVHSSSQGFTPFPAPPEAAASLHPSLDLFLLQ